MICHRCGKPMRFYGPWDEHPSCHYYHCDSCNRRYYVDLDDEEEENL